MIVFLKEKSPMFREGSGFSQPMWFEAGEEFEVISTKIMRHDNRAWYRLRSRRYGTSLEGLHNPDDFVIPENREAASAPTYLSPLTEKNSQRGVLKKEP